MSENTNKLTSSMFWSFSQSIGSQFVGIIVSTVLARLILPEAYGIIAAAGVFTSLATTFTSGGFGNALIQKKDADQKDYDTMFWFNVVLSVFIYGIVFVSAPLLINVFNSSFDKDLLVLVIRLLGIGIVLSSFNSFYRSILQKQLLFKKLFWLTLSGTVISACVGITLAFLGFGIWALVTQNLVSYFINSLFFVFFSKWKPHFYFSFKRLKPMFFYGSKMMLSGFMITVYGDLASLAIGNRYTSEDLAYYNKGINYPKLLALNIVSSINTALFPIMSKIQDAETLKKLVRKFNRISAFVITPMMLGFAAVGPAFVELLLTDRWNAAIPFLQICCINYAIQPIGMSSLQYLKASGKATEYLVLDMIRKCIGIATLVIAVVLNKGVIYIAIAEVISNFIAIFINMYPGKKHIGYSICEQITDVLPKFLLAGVMFAVVNCIGLINISLVVKFFIQIVIGMGVYIGIAKLLKMKELDELIAIAKRLLKK